MPSPLETVRTDVDLLIELVKNKKEISFDDAAKELKQPFSTVESWASFLEEEGIISIKYKFTTPYLFYAPSAGKAGSELEVKAASTFEEKIKEIENLLESAFSHIKNGNYDMAESIYPALNQEIRTIHQLMKEKDNLNKLPLGEGVIDKLSEVDKILEHAKELTEKGDYDQAREIYMQIHNEVREVILLVKEMNMELIRIYGEKEALTEKDKKIEEELDLKKVKDADELLKRAYEFLKSGEIEKAKRVYDKIQENYDELAEEYRGRKEELNSSLLKLNKDLSLHIGKVSMKDIEEKDREITRLVKEVRTNLEKNNIAGAEKLYDNVESIFKEFPGSFLERRLELEKKILDLREELIQKKKSFFNSELRQKSDEIIKLLAAIGTAMDKKDIKSAMDDYGKVKTLYSSLPSGFLNEKIALQDKIFEAYKKLVEINKEVSQEDFLAKTEKIGTDIQKIEQLLNSNELNPVEDFLSKAYGIFNQLPMGFLSEKTNIQDRLLKLSRRYADQKETYTVNQFNEKNESIKKLFRTIEHYLANKEFDLAKEVYSEITNVYNQLPAGFMKEKNELKTKILISYKKLMLGSDETFLRDVNQATKDKYENLLRLLIQIHTHIDAGEFDLIEPNYQHVISLYNELPLGFLTKKINIRDEIAKVYDELRLYNLTKQIDAMMRSKDYNRIIPLLNSLHELYHRLIEKNAQDVELFKLVNQRYESYLKVLRMYAEDETLIRQGVKTEIKPPVAALEQEPVQLEEHIDTEPKPIEPADIRPIAIKPAEIRPVDDITERLNRLADKKAEIRAHIEEAKKLEPRKKPEVPKLSVNQFREAYNLALGKLLAKDFQAAKQALAGIAESREWSASAKPLSELLEHLQSAPARLPDYAASLLSLAARKAESSYEGKLMLTKIIRGLNNYFAGDTASCLKDLERVRASFRNAFEVRELITFINSNPVFGAKKDTLPSHPREAEAAQEIELSSVHLEPPQLRPSVEKLLITRKLRRANEEFARGDYGAARDDFQRVLEIDPLNSLAKEMLQKISTSGRQGMEKEV